MAAVFMRYVTAAALLMATACMQAAPEVKILATDPGADALLARQQPFYVRFSVHGAAPATVTVSAWFKGAMVIDDGGTGAPAAVPADGTGVVSLFYWSERPTRIDELRLHVTDQRSGAKITDYAYPVALTWLTDDMAPREPAPWVKEWQQKPTARIAPRPPPGLQFVWWVLLAAAILLLAARTTWWLRRRARRDDAGGRGC